MLASFKFFSYIWVIRGRVSHWDRHLGMTAAMTQVPVPTAIKKALIIWYFQRFFLSLPRETQIMEFDSTPVCTEE